MPSMDPMSKAPLEIAIMILDRLPICDTWRLRSVSKAWNKMLSTETVVTAALNRWPTPSVQNSLSNRVERFKVEYTGRPLSFKTFELADAITPVWCWRDMTTLKGRYMAYLSRHNGKGPTTRYYNLSVVDLSTSKVIKYRPRDDWKVPRCRRNTCCSPSHRDPTVDFSQDRSCPEERCRSIILSDDLAGLVTHRSLLTVDRHSDGLHFRATKLPKAQPHCHLSHGYNVILLWADYDKTTTKDTEYGPATTTLNFNAWVYNHKSKTQRQFDIPPALLENDPGHHEFDSFFLRGEDLLVFSSTTVVGMHERTPKVKSEDGFRMVVRRFSLKGELLERLSFPNLIKHCHDPDDCGLRPVVSEALVDNAYHLIWTPGGECEGWGDMIVDLTKGVSACPRRDDSAFGTPAVWGRSLYHMFTGHLTYCQLTDEDMWSPALATLVLVPRPMRVPAQDADLYISESILLWRATTEHEGSHVHAFSLDPTCVLDSPVPFFNSISWPPVQRVWTWLGSNEDTTDEQWEVKSP